MKTRLQRITLQLKWVCEILTHQTKAENRDTDKNLTPGKANIQVKTPQIWKVTNL